jgi:hypothetical protein
MGGNVGVPEKTELPPPAVSVWITVRLIGPDPTRPELSVPDPTGVARRLGGVGHVNFFCGSCSCRSRVRRRWGCGRGWGRGWRHGGTGESISLAEWTLQEKPEPAFPVSIPVAFPVPTVQPGPTHGFGEADANRAGPHAACTRPWQKHPSSSVPIPLAVPWPLPVPFPVPLPLPSLGPSRVTGSGTGRVAGPALLTRARGPRSFRSLHGPSIARLRPRVRPCIRSCAARRTGGTRGSLSLRSHSVAGRWSSFTVPRQWTANTLSLPLSLSFTLSIPVSKRGPIPVPFGDALSVLPLLTRKHKRPSTVH